MKVLNLKYIVVLGILFLAQFLFTLDSQNQIRLEELSESVRNIYYLEKGEVFSGINSTFGWYTPLRLIYNIFGFSFEYAKYFRLFLQFISLICLTLLLGRIFSFKRSLIPLITIGLSPTLLFFNTLRTHYGIDLQYLPIILLFLSRIKFKGNCLTLLPHILVWSLSMIAWSSYHTFIYYLPAIFIYYVYQFFTSTGKKGRFKYLFVSLIAFLSPVILMILQVQNRQLLIFDPSVGGGLFRGPVGLDLAGSFQRVYYTFLAFLGASDSYYYEVKEPDFSVIFPLISIIVSIYLSAYLAVKRRVSRVVVSLIVLTVSVNILFQLIFSDSGGVSSVRRATAILASFYAFYVLGWIFVFEVKIKRLSKIILIFLLLLLPLHHLAVYWINLSHIKDISPYKEEVWLKSTGSPDEALRKYVEIAQKGELKLYVNYPNEISFGYVYNWIYTAIAGKCYWNKLDCHKIYGFDTSKVKFVELNLESVNYTHR